MNEESARNFRGEMSDLIDEATAIRDRINRIMGELPWGTGRKYAMAIREEIDMQMTEIIQRMYETRDIASWDEEERRRCSGGSPAPWRSARSTRTC